MTVTILPDLTENLKNQLVDELNEIGKAGRYVHKKGFYTKAHYKRELFAALHRGQLAHSALATSQLLAIQQATTIAKLEAQLAEYKSCINPNAIVEELVKQRARKPRATKTAE